MPHPDQLDQAAPDAITVSRVTKEFRVYERAYATLKAQTMHTLQRMLHRDARRDYTLKRALSDVSFTVPRGQAVAIVGHNGSGKSTLLSIMSRIYLPTSGEITINGRVSSLLELGLGFDGELTGIENVFFHCGVRGMDQDEIGRVYERIRAFSELDERTMSLPTRMYSSGMQARLGFAIAVSIPSDILVIDEGLAVGDVSFQEKSLAQLTSAKEQGKTIFLVSHDHQNVRRFADRAVWLDQGRLMLDGPSAEVVQAYERHMLN